MINIQSTLHTAPDWCRSASLAVSYYLIANVTYLQICVCVYIYTHTHTHTHTHTLFTIQRRWSGISTKKKWTNWMPSTKEIFSPRMPFWARVPYVRQPCLRVSIFSSSFCNGRESPRLIPISMIRKVAESLRLQLRMILRWGRGCCVQSN